MEISKSTHWRVARALLAVFCACAIALAGMLVAQPAQQAYAANGKTGAEVMFRLYNPNSGEHFYTSSEVERDNCVNNGWDDEGRGWVAPTEGEPVYRVYNPNAGEHHYTMSTVERDSLVAIGWVDEGERWRSNATKHVVLYRLDKTIVFHFYDFVLVLSAVSSRCQLYSVGLSQRKLIPNSALFILPFREFYA